VRERGLAGWLPCASSPLAVTVCSLVRYDYTEDEWFRVPVTQRRDHWSRPYFDEGGGDIWMVTYSVPFNRHGALAGVWLQGVRSSERGLLSAPSHRPPHDAFQVW